jgi:uncharacterized membrane protein
MGDETSGTDRWVEGGKDIYGKAKGIAQDKTKGGPTEMFVVAFDGVGQADEVLGTLRELDDGRLVELGKAAVVRRGTDGVIDIEETADMDTKESAITGAVAGGLLGMLTGKGLVGGALLGAGGGALASKGLDLGFDDDFLAEFGDKLGPDSSAIVATVDFVNLDAAMEVLDRFEGGTILHSTLQPEITAQLSDAVED